MKWFYVLLLFLVCTVSSFAANTKEQIHQAMHQVYIVRPDGDVTCTLYAVGPHTVITASHCFTGQEDTDVFLVNNEEEDQMAVADKVIQDGNDHAIIILKPVDVKDRKFTEFKTWITDLTFYQLKQGDKVYKYGFTSVLNCHDCYTEGIFSGLGEIEDRTLYLFQLPSAPGDSGSLIFDAQNHLVGLISLSNISMSISGGFGFTADDYKQIR
jgi:hypothetical protein